VQPGEIEFVTPHPDRGTAGSTGKHKPPGSGVRWLVWGLAIAVAVTITAVGLGNRPQPVTPVSAPGPIRSSAVATPAVATPVGDAPAPPDPVIASGADGAVFAPDASPQAVATGPVTLQAQAQVLKASTTQRCVATLMKRLFGMADAYHRARAAGHSAAGAERVARDHLGTVLSAGTHRYTVTARSWTLNRTTLVRGSGKLDLTGACGADVPTGASTVRQAGPDRSG